MDNQSNSKQKKDNQSSRDLLSNFPLGIIHNILARVPIDDAVRTSTLSWHWKYIWASLPQLAFDDECVTLVSGEIVRTAGKRLKNIINEVLLLHKREEPILKFKLDVTLWKRCPEIDRWILHLSRKDIRELILIIGDNSGLGHWFPVYSNLYSCRNLTHLNLSGFELYPPPSTFKGFLFLRFLVLDVYASSKEIESIVNNSPLLESFELEDYVNSELRISAPNLKRFHFRGENHYKEIRVCAPLLSEILVRVGQDDSAAEHVQETSVCNYTELLGGFTNLKKLTAGAYFAKYLSFGIESCHESLIFHHLNDIELGDVNFRVMKEISVVVRLITGAPNLRKLTISSPFHIREEADAVQSPHESIWGFGSEPNFTFEKLRVVKMEKLNGYPPEMELIKFLLKSSPVLETMNLDAYSRVHTKSMLDSMAELLSYRRASTNSEILFKHNMF